MRYLTKKDLQERVYGLDAYRPGAPSARDFEFYATSGTTGAPILLTRPTTTKRRQFVPHRQKRIVMLLPKRSIAFSMPHSILTFSPETERILNFDPGDLDNPALGRLLEEFGPQEIRAIVAYLEFFLGKMAVRCEKIFRQIRSVNMLGESLSARRFAFFTAMLPAASVGWTYGLSEAGIAGMPCAHLLEKYAEERFSLFHPVEDTGVHIIDPDENRVGEIAVTVWRGGPYRTGDFGQIWNERCPCGKTQILRVLGRRDYDLVPCVGTTFHRSRIEAILDPFLDTILKDYCIEVSEEQKGARTLGKVTLTVEPKGHPTEQELRKLARNFAERLFVTPTRTLAQLETQDIFLPMELQSVRNLTKGTKTIRLRKRAG